jgi:hypothetical protein
LKLATAQRTDEWIGMAEAARRAGVTGPDAVRKFRRRIQDLNENLGGQILRRTGSGKKKVRFEVSAQGLLHYQRVDIEQRDAEVAQLSAELEETKRRLDRLRDQVMLFRKQARDWFTKAERTATRSHE